MKPAYIIAFFVIGGCMAVTLISFGSSMTHHVNVAQAIQRAGETVQVPGDIVKESVVYDAAKGSLKFDVICKADKSKRLTIVYPEPKPENFDTANAVEAIGTYKDGVFLADRLLVKCPSKYNDEQPATGEKKPNGYGDPAAAPAYEVPGKGRKNAPMLQPDKVPYQKSAMLAPTPVK